MKRRTDFSRGIAYSAPDWAPLRIFPGGNRSCLPAFDLVPKKLESLPHVHDPRLLRIELHAQFVQNPSAAATAVRASAADSQVATQSSAYLVYRFIKT